MKIGYFTNQYPKVSHSFIRREILALEKMGTSISRFALKSYLNELVDKNDIEEYKKTKYILSTSKIIITKTFFLILINKPFLWLKTLLLANKIGFKSERGLFRHYIYFLEACILSDWIEKDNIQHLHAHFGTNPAAIALLASKLSKIPFSFTVHGPEEFDKPNFISLPEKIKSAAFVIAISSFGKSQLYRLVPNQYWEKIKIVHCGLEKSFYHGTFDEIGTKNHLVCIGRLCEQKGQILLIEALNILAKKGVNFSLTLVGDGDMRTDIENKIAEYNLQRNINITGWQSCQQVKKLILQSKLTVLPSFAEGLPVVIMESMSLSKPVISTFIAGIPELITHNENGWLVPAGDSTKLSEAIEEALNLNNFEITEIGNRAKKVVTQRHNIDIEAKKLISHFKNICKKRSIS